jgi:hypothetical protein
MTLLKIDRIAAPLLESRESIVFRHRSWPVSKSHAFDGIGLLPWKSAQVVREPKVASHIQVARWRRQANSCFVHESVSPLNPDRLSANQLEK